MKKIIYIVVAVVLIAIVAVRLTSNKKTVQERVYHYDKEEAVNVEAVTIKPKAMANEKTYSGSFEPNKETKISADIQGKIIAVLVDEGSPVKKGQALVQLDNSLLKLQQQTIEVQIEGLEADVKRYTVLSDAGAIQEVQLEKATLGLKSAKVQKATIVEQISKTTITAPFSGIVTARFTEEGAFAAPGVPLLQITDLVSLKFTILVPENELVLFELNQSHPVSVDAFPKIRLTGKVSMTGSKSNRGNSFPVQLSVNNTTDIKIKSGMFGKVNIANDNPEKQIIIPASAVVGTAQLPQVFMVKDKKAVLQNIVVSQRFGNKAVISEGIREGDIVVTGGFINLFEGANVNVVLKSEL